MDVDDTWATLTVFSKSHIYPTKRLVFLTAHGSQQLFYNQQLFFQKSQLNQTHSKTLENMFFLVRYQLIISKEIDFAIGLSAPVQHYP